VETKDVHLYLLQIYTTSHLAGLYLKQYYPNVKNVLVGGNDSMAKEIASHGYNVIQPPHVAKDMLVS
jgi:ribonucleotide monophosphatase NagD (HAD superfamily)